MIDVDEAVLRQFHRAGLCSSARLDLFLASLLLDGLFEAKAHGRDTVAGSTLRQYGVSFVKRSEKSSMLFEPVKAVWLSASSSS